MNILLAEDHNVLRTGLKLLLEVDEKIKVVAQANNGQQVLELLESNDQVDLILSDIDMPVMDGISLTAALKNSGCAAKVIILSMHESETYVHQAFQAGASGYLLKSVGSEELIYAVKHVYEGGDYLSSELTRAMLKKNMEGSSRISSVESIYNSFSARELEVLHLIAEGLTNQQMSDKLFLSKRTIEGHRQNLIDKTGARNTAGLITFALRNGVIQ